MIPTRHKSKLPKTLTWPLGAEAISTGLVDVPHASELTLSYHGSANLPASAFQRLLRESLPYAILIAEFHPASNPGYSGAAFMVERGWYAERWELQVHPVMRPLRSVAGLLLRAQGLPALAEWLRGSDRTGWKMRQHRIEFVFRPIEETLTAQVVDGV